MRTTHNPSSSHRGGIDQARTCYSVCVKLLAPAQQGTGRIAPHRRWRSGRVHRRHNALCLLYSQSALQGRCGIVLCHSRRRIGQGHTVCIALIWGPMPPFLLHRPCMWSCWRAARSDQWHTVHMAHRVVVPAHGVHHTGRRCKKYTILSQAFARTDLWHIWGTVLLAPSSSPRVPQHMRRSAWHRLPTPAQHHRGRRSLDRESFETCPRDRARRRAVSRRDRSWPPRHVAARTWDMCRVRSYDRHLPPQAPCKRQKPILAPILPA